MKKLLFLSILTLLPMLASAEENNVCGDGLTYSFDKSSNTLTISKTGEGTGKMYDYDSNASGQPTWSDHYQTDVHTVIIEDGVTSIGDCAFFYCNLLSSVSIPSSVTSIGNKAFYCCFKLTSIEIPENVVSIGSEAFEQCGIASIVIPNSVTSIGSEAFRSCENLTSVSIPNSMTSIEYGLFQLCSGLTSVIIGDGVTSIGSQAFYGCSSLTTVMIGNSVTSIGSFVFCNCSNLTDVYCSAEVVPGTKSNAFSGSPIETASLRVPEASIDAYKTTAPWNGFGNILALTGQEWDHEYFPFVEEGKVWNCWTDSPSGADESGELPTTCIFTMAGDTLINENTYKKVSCQFKDFYGDEEQHYFCAVREEAYRVFVVENETKEEKVLYDFSHPQEELILSVDGQKYARRAGFHFNFGGIEQLCYELYRGKGEEIDYDYHYGDYWIEGAGISHANPFAVGVHGNDPDSFFGYQFILNSCMKGEKRLFHINWIVIMITNRNCNCEDDDDDDDLTSYPIAIDENHFPDPVFREWLMTWPWAADGILTEEEANQVEFLWGPNGDNLNIYMGIKSLKGIEFFPNLVHLSFQNQELTEVDISKNTELNILSLENNQITSIDLSNNPNLYEIYLSGNRLTTIDLSRNINVSDLRLQNNQLTSLDLSGLTYLDCLFCFGNQIKGEAMDALIASLRPIEVTNVSSPGMLYGIKTDDPNEGNVITKAQVEAAKAKGWIIMDYAWKDGSHSYYPGSDEETMTGLENVSVSDSSSEWYRLSGQKSASPKRGLNIVRMKDGTTKKIIF